MKKLLLILTLITVFSTGKTTAQTALSFDGTNDYVRSSSNVSMGSTWTYETWVKSNDSSPDWSGIITSNSSIGTGMWFQFCMNMAGNLRWESNTPTLYIPSIPGSFVNDNTWHHVAVTCDATNITFYLDGNQVHQQLFSGGTMDRPIQIMAERATNQWVKGEADRTMIWDYARSASEITSDMSSCLTGNEPGLIIYYDYENGTGSSIVTDLAGGNNNGDLINMNPSTDWIAGSGIACTSCIAEQNISALQSTLCNNETTTVDLDNSETGVNYYLRDDFDDSVIDGPVAGTGSSISLNTGNITSTTTYNVYAETTPPTPNALEFTGNWNLKRVNLGTNLYDDNLVGTSQVTVEAWVNRSATGSLHTVLGNYQPGSASLLFRIDNDKIIFHLNSSTTATSSTSIPTNTWTHIAGTYDGTTIKVYVNGVLDGQTAFSGTLDPSAHPMLIAGGLSNNTEYFPGDIADVRFWNTSRTAAEITASMNTILTGSETGLLANYQFTEGSGTTTANSATGNAYPGTIFNNPAWVTGPTLTGNVCTLEMNQTATVTINQPTTGSQTLVECAGFSVTVGTSTYTTTGVYTDVLTNAAGCDSTVTTDLTINQPTTGSQTFVECAGFSVTVGTNTYNTTGIYTDVLTNAAGCDSTVTTDLTINQPTTGTQTFVECAGFSVTVGTSTYTTTGVYTDVLTNASGCDSTVTTDLTINQPTTGSQTFVECAGFSVTVGTSTYTTTGIYTDVLTNAAGCDSTVTTDLTINQPTTGSQTFVECAGFSVTVGTSTYTTTGVYTDVLTNAAGCDSTITTDLTINQPTTGSQTLVECAGFSVTVGTNTYNTTGVYTDVLTNAAGCDSTVTTDLTISTAIDVTVDNTSLPTLTANQSGATYQWIDCDNGNAPIVDATNQTYTATENGNYAVEVTVGSCTETSACENVSNVSLNELEHNSISIYPNPTNSILNLNFDNITGSVNYTLTTIEGRLIEQQQNVSVNTISIDISNESKGIYLLKVDNNTSAHVYKIVKQ